MFANLNTDPGNETSASWELGDLSRTRVSSTCPNSIGIKEAHAVKNEAPRLAAARRHGWHNASRSRHGWLALGYAFVSISLHCCRAPLDMTKNEHIAKELKTRLSELTARLAEIDGELRKPLSADSEERATDLENQDALEGIKNSEIQEVHQIQGALRRIAEGTYGVCVQCGADIDPKRLEALPIATRCISCAA